MLDFYKIAENIPKPEWPEKIDLKRIDGLELYEFEELQNKNLLSRNLDYWSDIRWSNNSTLELHQKLIDRYPELGSNKLKNTSIVKFFNIVNEACKDGLGIIAYCD